MTDEATTSILTEDEVAQALGRLHLALIRLQKECDRLKAQVTESKDTEEVHGGQ